MITKEKWAEIIKDFHEKKLPETINREIKVSSSPKIKRAVSFIGPRRAGKTYEMFILIKELTTNIKKERILYINLERADLGVVTYSDLVVMLEAYYQLYPENKKEQIWLFLDEIQNVSLWEKFVRTCLDEGIKIFITGSSSKLLSKEIATSMRGRTLTYKVLPFSFKEFLEAKSFKKKEFYSSTEKALLLNYLDEYFLYGGYPEAVIYKEEKEKILRDIFDTAILKDIIERHKIRNNALMKNLIKALLVSKEFSINKFHNYLKSQGIKAGKNALYNYLGYLEDAFFVFSLRKFSLSYKKSEQTIPKIYFIDNGLLTINNIDDKGRLMENLVFTELLRKELDISYYQTLLKEEVDFVIKEGKKVKELIQVCYNIEDFMTEQREINALLKASNEFNCNKLIIITKEADKENVVKDKKIIYIPLWKYLLQN